MTLFSDEPGDDGLPGPRRRLAMSAVMTATAMAVLDGSMVNVALPQIARALDAPAGGALWVANAYLLAVAMTLALFAALAARTGFRRLFAAGLAVFTLASLGCALAPSLEVLVALRVLQGVGAAACLSIAPAIHRTIFPQRLLGRILGLNALLIAACTAAGPTLGGALLSWAGWPWLFAVNVPLGAVGVALALRALPGESRTARGRFDGAGAVLSAAAMGAFLLAADACARLGSDPHAGRTAGLYGALAFGAGWAFVRRQRRAAAPLIPLDIFASARFTLAALASLASFVGQGIAFVALPFLFQTVHGDSALHSALLFTPWPIGIMLAAPHAGRLADRHPAAVLSSAGLALLATGLACLALLPAEAQAWDIAWRNLLCGIGFGLFQSPNNREMLANVARERSSNASAILSIVRTFGQCLGTALVGIVLSLLDRDLAGGAAGLHAIRLCLGIAVAATVVALAVSASRLRGALER
ncbi:MFS transporter [uncultured Massilia sp.]|uniref:MFS transporter n=1 Tax=uncultured Massilia sp. TaxID=169973 RepID=UPI0025F62C6F|nr:MFS transporter [uncultured Massilia sp.]